MKRLFIAAALIFSAFSASANTYSQPALLHITTEHFTVTQNDFTIVKGKVLCNLIDSHDNSQHIGFRMGDVTSKSVDSKTGKITIDVAITWRADLLSWSTISDCE